MIPSVVAYEVARVPRDFLAEQENIVKGPYLSIAPSPKLAPEGDEPFQEVPLGFTPYRNQRIAHERLRSGGRTAGPRRD